MCRNLSQMSDPSLDVEIGERQGAGTRLSTAALGSVCVAAELVRAMFGAPRATASLKVSHTQRATRYAAFGAKATVMGCPPAAVASRSASLTASRPLAATAPSVGPTTRLPKAICRFNLHVGQFYM